MRPPAAAALLAGLLLAPVLASAADSGDGAGPTTPPEVPDVVLAAAALSDLLPYAGRGDWDNATRTLGTARSHAVAFDHPTALAGSTVNATLDAVGAALRARDVAAVRLALASARAAMAEAGYARESGAVVILATGESRSDAGVGAVGLDSSHHRQRLHARVAEEARVALRLWSFSLREGLPGEAAVWSATAKAWMGVLGPEALRLPPATKLEWDRLLQEVDRTSLNDSEVARVERELRPLLLGLGLGRTLVRLDDLADEVLTAALAAQTAVALQRELPTFGTVALRDASLEDLDPRYAAVRGDLFLGGEGGVEPLDANVTRLRSDLHGGASLRTIQRTLGDVRDDLARLAHFTFGAFVKAQFVHVRPERPVQQDLQAGRFPFEGVASWNVTFRFDPSVAVVDRVDRVHFQLDDGWWDNDEGRVELGGSAAPPVLRDGVLARVTWRAVGPALAETNVTLSDVVLRDPARQPLELFLVAPGRVIVAHVEDAGKEGAEEDPLAPTNPDLGRRSPGLGGALVAAAAAGAAVMVGRRRQLR